MSAYSGDDPMRSIFLMTVLLAAALSESVPAEIVEVPLPELRGRYYTEDTVTRYASFRIDPVPISITAVSIRILGTHTLGEIWCEMGSPILVPLPYSTAFCASMPDTVNGYLWMAGHSSQLPSGDFEIILPFRELYGWHVTWDFLLAGYGEVRLDGPGEGFVLVCTPTIWPDATVAEATLIVEGEFPVATESNTWGSIKALFRR